MFFNKDGLKALAMLTQIAISMMVSIGIGLLVGMFLDKKLGTAPIFLIVFILLGTAAGFRNIYHMTRSFIKSPSQTSLKEKETLDQIKEEEAKNARKNWNSKSK